jgi:hypothetical protein
VRYTHQRINEQVFAHPDEVMENILRVTSHIAGKLAGVSDLSRRVLTVVPSRDGKPWVRDAEGGWWRTYLFIEGAHSLDVASNPGEARFLGRNVALFQRQLSDLGGARLHETIPGFHDMEKRYLRFYDVVSKDSHDRVKDVPEEIAFMRENEERGGVLIRALRSGSLPLRICHNDTKMNNILIDDGDAAKYFGASGSEASGADPKTPGSGPETSGSGPGTSGSGPGTSGPGSDPVCCVLDLDTVMPGTILFDVGDLVRTVPARAEEDERDLSKAGLDFDLFEALLDGYLSAASVFLIPEEKALLCESGRNITQIMALRFLTDYLEGDHYYQTARPDHNRDRCRNQIAHIKSMDAQWERMEKIVSRVQR